MAKKFTFLEECLQVLAALHLGFLQSLYVTVIIIIFYVTLFTSYWPIVLLSIVWTWYDRKTPNRGGRRILDYSQTINLPEHSRITKNIKWFTKIIKWSTKPSLKNEVSYRTNLSEDTANNFLNWILPQATYRNTLLEAPSRLLSNEFGKDGLDPNRNYIFCSHPHGLLSLSVFINFSIGLAPTKVLFPGFSTKITALHSNMIYPIFRDIAMGYGLVSASKESLNYLLNDSQKGNIIGLVIGGANEVAYSEPGQYRIILNRKKGFVKLALTLGCGLVPVISFGENDIYELLKPNPGTIWYSLQQWLKRMTGFLLVLPMGRFGLPFFPKRIPLTTVVGRPIEIPKIAEPNQEQIDQYHKLYTEELIKLFNEHKYKYVDDPENTHLEIVE